MVVKSLQYNLNLNKIDTSLSSLTYGTSILHVDDRNHICKSSVSAKISGNMPFKGRR